ncbi:MAG: hypothetical protein WD768_16245 [Phycisphaeraceae bacterium]
MKRALLGIIMVCGALFVEMYCLPKLALPNKYGAFHYSLIVTGAVAAVPIGIIGAFVCVSCMFRR